MPIRDVISDTKVPVKLWTPLDGVEPGAVEQLRNVANLPISHKHVAVMPDVHFGYGATVGTVMVTKDAIVPAAVGVDIGCGMMAVQVNADPDMVLAKAQQIKHSIERSVPTGFNVNRDITPEVEAWPRWDDDNIIPGPWDKEGELLDKAKHQMGTLGGGNHFIEVSLDENRRVWVMLHSGSRRIGLEIANEHINYAKEMMKRWHITLPDPYLAYLPRGDHQFDHYMKALDWAQKYAWANREEMMRKVLKDLDHALNGGKPLEKTAPVHCHHNYGTMENHFGENVIVVRKGATSAREGEMGIIPGSMGAKSYITRGKGNPDSFCSSSHGAGRRMGRKEAKRRFTVDDLKAQTEGVLCRKDADVIDEIPAAYKDVETVMAHQSDLVDIVATLKQVISIKGGGNPDKD